MEQRDKGNCDRKELIEQLDRHIDWIKSCDTKASIVLAVTGIFLTILTSDRTIDMLNHIFVEIFQSIDFANILFFLFFLISSYLFIYGSYNLIRVLIPRMSNEAQLYMGTDVDSLYFFEAIANNTYSEFKEKVISRSEEDDINDILSQIFVNAKISTVKYTLYHKGIKYSFLGITGVLFFYIIGMILLKTGGFA